MLTAAGIATVPGIFIGAGIAVGGGILIDRGIDTLKQDLILDKDKQLDNKGRGKIIEQSRTSCRCSSYIYIYYYSSVYKV